MNNICTIRLLFAFLLLLFADGLATATEVKVIKLAVTNPSETVRLSENIVVQVAALQTITPDFQPDSATVWASNASTIGEDAKTRERIELPSQVDDVNGDQKADELVFQIDLQPKQTRIVTIAFGDPAKLAELRGNYPSRTNAKFTTKFEGLGWESDINAWRLYFDKRNAIDLFGKRRPGLSLETFGKPDHNYHEESPFGRDIYKIGNALGIGAIGALVDGKVVKVAEVNDRSWKIVSSGPVRTIVELNYKGWQVAGRSVDLTSRMTVWAGERGFDHRIITRNAEGLTLVTGLPRKPGLSEVGATETNSNVRVVATWGHQVLMTGATATDSLPDQNLGLVVMLPSRGASTSSPADADNLLIVIPPNEAGAHWYVSAAWDQEGSENQPGSTAHAQKISIDSKAITTRDDFVAYIKELSLRFTTPSTVTILSKSAVSSPHPKL
jgi:Domain of unknown function (DUF4861)